MAMVAVANQDIIGCAPDLEPEKEERVFKRETSVDDAATAVPSAHPTQDSLSSLSEASDSEESEAREASDAGMSPRLTFSYSRSLMLQVRLQLAVADEEEPALLGAKNRLLRPPPGLEVQESAGEAAAEASACSLTTMMLRNLPNQCSRSSLEKFLCRMGFDGAFDLVYMPVDRTNGNNLGYAFINFTEASSCQRFIGKMHNTKASKCFPGSRSAKVLQCCYAKVQGREPYLQGLANANKLAGAESAWESMQASCASDAVAEAEESQESATPAASSRGLRAEASDFVPGAMGVITHSDFPELSSQSCRETSGSSSSSRSAVMGAPWRRTAAAEVVQSQESPTPAASSKGLRAEAPDFVPGAMGEITSTDEFLEVLTGMPVSELALSHRQAVARARHCAARHSASQLFIPVKA